MSDKPVSPAQSAQVGKLANDKGIGCFRFQHHALDNGMMSDVLEAITGPAPRNIAIPLIRLPTMSLCSVKVELDMKPSWRQLVLGSCPSTDRVSSVLEDFEQCTPIVYDGTVDEIILINAQANNGWGRAFHLAQEFGLDEAHPRWVYSLAKARPRLHHDLGLRRLWVIATQGCLIKGQALAHGVNWDGGDYVEAIENPIQFYENRDEFWFAFRKPF